MTAGLGWAGQGCAGLNCEESRERRVVLFVRLPDALAAALRVYCQEPTADECAEE